MDRLKVGALLAAAIAFAGVTPPALAEQSVTVNGMTFTCTNSCNVTISGDSFSVVDCCGGRVRIRFPNRQ